MEKVDTISSRIVKAMQIRNMKQADIIQATGIGKSSLSQYISNKCEPKADKIFLISKALNVAENWLMGFDVPMYRTDNLYLNMDDIPPLIHQFISDNDNLKMLLGLCCSDDEIKTLDDYKKLNLQGRQRLSDYLNELLMLPLYTENAVNAVAANIDKTVDGIASGIEFVSGKIANTLVKVSDKNKQEGGE